MPAFILRIKYKIYNYAHYSLNIKFENISEKPLIIYHIIRRYNTIHVVIRIRTYVYHKYMRRGYYKRIRVVVVVGFLLLVSSYITQEDVESDTLGVYKKLALLHITTR